jgi:hypothetical protein
MLWASFFWGLAEGIFFFVVPDVILSAIATCSLATSLRASLLVVLGAVVAACLLYCGLFIGGDSALSLIHSVWSFFPGYTPKMDDLVREHLSRGARGLLSGPQSGIPYRVYVVEAWKQQISLLEILLWTPFARFERILIAPVVVGVMKHILAFALKKRRVGESTLSRVLLIAIALYWVVIYFWYWGFFIPANYAG